MTSARVWAQGLTLSVTGLLSREDREAIRQLVERAGGSYSPNLSRRCTHLAVAPPSNSSVGGGAVSGAVISSDKLRIAQRNQAKWGLQIVDLGWVVACADAGRRLPEQLYPAKLPLLPPPSAAEPSGRVTLQPQPINARAQVQHSMAAASSAAASVAETVCGVSSRPAHSAATPASPPHHPSLWARSSRSPITQPVTQPASVVPGASGRGSALPDRAHSAAYVPVAVQQAQREPGSSSGNGWLVFEFLPMTQAGFLPTADLMAQLRVSARAGASSTGPPSALPALVASTAAAAPAATGVAGVLAQHSGSAASGSLCSAAASGAALASGAPGTSDLSILLTRLRAATAAEQQPAGAATSAPAQHCIAVPVPPAPAPTPATASATEGTAGAEGRDLSDLLQPLRALQQPAAAPAAAAAAGPSAAAAAAGPSAAAAAAAAGPSAAAAPHMPAAGPSCAGSFDDLLQQLKAQQATRTQPEQQPPKQRQQQRQEQQCCESASPAAGSGPISRSSGDLLLQQLQALAGQRAQHGAKLEAPVPEQEQREQTSWLPPPQYQRQTIPPPLVEQPLCVVYGGAAGQQVQPGGSGSGSSSGSGASMAPTLEVEEPAEEFALLQPPTQELPLSPSGDQGQERACDGPSSAHPAAAGQGGDPCQDERGSQVANSERGVFGGLVTLVDPALPREDQQRVRHALEAGGGRVQEGAHLGQGVTHVVCAPEAALKWLSMGLGIVSPQWVLQSLRAGKQRRCLSVSADASRHLPAGLQLAAAPRQESAAEAGGQGPGSSSHLAPPGQALSPRLLQSREARQQVLAEMAASAGGGAGERGGTAAAAAAPHQQGSTPASLLAGLCWAVTEHPTAARLETTAAAAEAPGGAPEWEPSEDEIIPDSEDEEEERRLAQQQRQQQFCCLSATQAAVEDVLLGCRAPSPPATAMAAGSGSSGSQRLPSWMEETVLTASTLTVLLPRDQHGELGHESRSWQLQQRQLSAGDLLGHIHAYYQEAVPAEEQMALLRAHPGARAAAQLERAFLEMAALQRGALLGPRVAFEGLRKATREPAGSVYEVQLGR